MASKVYFHRLRTRDHKGNKTTKILDLFKRTGFDQTLEEGDLVAIKLHFGEKGSDAFIKPIFVRPIADRVKEMGAKPFLTDTNTLYSGSRHNAVDHLTTALEHGFVHSVTGAPVLISDGLKSNNFVEVDVGKKNFTKVRLAQDLVDADRMIVMSHFKGHEVAGFGGAIKNLAMGGAPAAGKKDQHSVNIEVDEDACIGCGKCQEVCPQGAMSINEGKASVDDAFCIGCGECLTVCTENAVGMDWELEIGPFMERMTEYAYGIASCHKDRAVYINFLTDITPDCDCTPWSDAPIVPDIGFLASLDPVAIDQASLDLINQQVGCAGSMLESGREGGSDKFHCLRPNTQPSVQLSYGEEIGLGTRDYELVEL